MVFETNVTRIDMWMKIHTIYFCYSTGFESKTSFKDELGVEAEEGNKMLLHLMTMSERHNYSAYAKGYQLFIYVLLVFISSIFACFCIKWFAIEFLFFVGAVAWDIPQQNGTVWLWMFCWFWNCFDILQT